MNSDDLKKIQAPLKEKYRDHPASSLITLKATGRLGEGISCKLETQRAVIDAGLHPATVATTEQLESLKKLTERYCVVYQTIFKGVPIDTNYKLK
jgi:uncharacterized OsmC-like protein